MLDTIEAAYATLQEQADIVTKSNLSSSREELAEMAKEKVNLFLSVIIILDVSWLFSVCARVCVCRYLFPSNVNFYFSDNKFIK